MFQRRQFLKNSVLAATTSLAAGLAASPLYAQAATPTADTFTAEVLHPLNRVPASFIIDDSTCLVNMGRYCMPQFASTWPDRAEYQRNWQEWPTEIPDTFVQQFGEWCGHHGIKGKYSIVPYPACVGWLDRELPGWSRQQLKNSLRLVQDLLLPNWDIHPEMITHTRVIDISTGRPFADVSPAYMENWFPQNKVSVDQLASYLAYALKIIQNCGLPCEGVTTPGGFGNLVKPELGLAVQQALNDTFRVEIPHYFKYVAEGNESTQPQIEHLELAAGQLPRLTVNVLAGTGDWFGGWDGAEVPQPDLYISADGTTGRMAELIRRRQHAVMLCHWPGLYCNGQLQGFKAFQQVITRIEEHFPDEVHWMKLSEIARYAAAQQLTNIRVDSSALHFSAPFACPQFTIRVANLKVLGKPRWQVHPVASSTNLPLTAALSPRLQPDCYLSDENGTVFCINLPGGDSTISW